VTRISRLLERGIFLVPRQNGIRQPGALRLVAASVGPAAPDCGQPQGLARGTIGGGRDQGLLNRLLERGSFGTTPRSITVSSFPSVKPVACDGCMAAFASDGRGSTGYPRCSLAPRAPLQRAYPRESLATHLLQYFPGGRVVGAYALSHDVACEKTSSTYFCDARSSRSAPGIR
jgi:hypothetical protein